MEQAHDLESKWDKFHVGKKDFQNEFMKRLKYSKEMIAGIFKKDLSSGR